jgi:elongation factor G
MLIEHLLYTANATDRVGSVDSGNTQSDFDPLEIKRKISLSMSVLPLEWHGCKINLIDVPGYPDFVGELHCVARAVESFILVCEAKRDLDVGFELAWEIADQYGLAKCIFVNKLERDNADYEGLIETLHERYGKSVVGVQIPIGHQAAFSGVLDLLNMKVYKGKDRGVEIEEIPSGYQQEAEYRREKMMDAAAEGDDALAMKYLDGEDLTEDEVEHGLLVGVERGRVVPIMVGSAMSGIGATNLLDRIIHELPSPFEAPKDANGVSVHKSGEPPLIDCNSGTVSSLCFKTTADPFVGKINFLRVFSGEIHPDEQVINVSRESNERLHNLFFPHGKTQEIATFVGPGDICAVAKLTNTHTGDTLCSAKNRILLPPIAMPEPIYRVAIHPKTKSDEDKLPGALEKLMDEDPTFKAYRDPAANQEILEGMGDIHLDTLVDRLKSKFGVEVAFEDARVPYRETIRKSTKAQGKHKRQSGGKGQYGDCHIELQPLGRGEGFIFENKVVGGSIPKNYIPAIEKGIREAMEHGFISGNPAIDMKIVVYDGSYHDVDSSEQAFKIAGAIAVRTAFAQADPVLLEPILEIEVDVNDDHVGDVVGDLNGRRGHLLGMDPITVGKTRIRSYVPMSNMMRYALDLRGITKGRGRFRQHFAHYAEVPYPDQLKIIAEFEKCRGELETKH